MANLEPRVAKLEGRVPIDQLDKAAIARQVDVFIAEVRRLASAAMWPPLSEAQVAENMRKLRTQFVEAATWAP